MSTIFVFGSNQAGVHGAGAARYAYDKLGAKWGVGEGLTGQSYALPTKDKSIRTRPLEDIQESVVKFLCTVKEHPDDTFVLTPVGCGLAGLNIQQIAGLFPKVLPINLTLHTSWFDHIKEKSL